MKLRAKAYLKDVDSLFETEDNYVLSSDDRLDFLSKKTLKTESSILDFMLNAEYYQDENSDYLVEISPLRRIKIRNIHTKEEIHATDEFQNGFLPYKASFTLDGKELLLIAAFPSSGVYPDFFSQFIKDSYEFELLRLSLPRLEILEHYPMPSMPCDIKRISFLNGHLIQDNQGKYYFISPDSTLPSFVSYPLSRMENETLIVNEARKEFYLKSNLGIKVYDGKLEETDSLVFFDNNPLLLDCVYKNMYQKKPDKEIWNNTVNTSFRRYIGEICVFKKDNLLYTINDMLTMTCKVMLYSFLDKSQQEIVELCDFVSGLGAFEDCFYFLTKKRAYFMEATNG